MSLSQSVNFPARRRLKKALVFRPTAENLCFAGKSAHYHPTTASNLTAESHTLHMKYPNALTLISLVSLVLAVCLSAADLPVGQTGAEITGVKEVIIVYKTHFDIGYTDLATNVVQRYRTSMIDLALKVADQNRGLPPDQQFAWTIPGWPMKKILEDWPGQTPERQTSIMQAFREGRFVVHALPFTTHTELLEAEDLVRGMRFSSEISRANGKPLPRDAKMTDVPSHSWILPTLLKHAGVDFLHLGCNPASSSPKVPMLFWWQGPDGSRVLTMYSAGDYGGGLVPPPGWPHQTWLAVMMTGDNHGPPTPEEVRRILEEAKIKLPGARARVGRLSDFSDAILAERPNLPVVVGDMADTWIYGPMSDPAGAKIARNIRPAIAATELLGTELRAWGVPITDSRTSIADAYEQSLLYGEHTWGGAFTWIYGRYLLKFGEDWRQDRAQGKFQRIESSWDEHTAYIMKAKNLVEPALRSDLETLAGAIKVPGRRIAVFNALPWSRTGLVSVPVNGQPGGITDIQTGQKVPWASNSDGTISFVATEVPPGGYRSFSLRAEPATAPAPEPWTPSNNQIENAFFKVVIDPEQGTVRSLVEKRSGREWVDASAPQSMGQYLYQTFDRDQVREFVKAYVKIDAEWGTNELGKPNLPPVSEAPYRAASPGHFQVRYERTPISVTAVMVAPAGEGVPHAVTTRLTLYHAQPWIDLEMTVHDKPYNSRPEAGWICLPFKLDEPAFRLGRLGGIVNPALDIVAGCNFHQFALNGGMTVVDGAGRGVGLCPWDSPLVSLGEPGCWKYSTTFTPRKSRVFINLFNNQWSTNFRLWNQGTWTSRVRLWGVDRPETERDLTTPSEEARFPLLAAVADGPAGKLPSTQAGLHLSQRGVKVSCFGPNPDGEGLVLRLWEQAGRSGLCEVTLPSGMKVPSVQPVDLRGRPIGASIPVKAGCFKTEIRPFAPVSFIFSEPQLARRK
jgi:hypothetical protein